MAGTDRTLRINDGFSSVLDRYAAKVEQAVSAEERWTGVTDQVIADQQRWGAALDMAQYKTLTYRDSIENMQEALRIFATEGASLDDLNAATDNLTASLERAGLSFSDVADGMDKFYLLTQNSIPKLVKSGVLIDNMAEAEKRATEEAEELAEAQDKATGEKTQQKMGFLGKRILGMGLMFVSAQKLLQYFKAAAERAPDAIAKKFTKLKESISNVFAGPTVAAMNMMTAGVDRLNEALNSPAGQKFLRIMEAVGRIVGTVVSWAFEALASVIEWAGDKLEKYGDQVQKAFGVIGGVMYSIKALVNNLFAWLYNSVMELVDRTMRAFTFGRKGMDYTKREYTSLSDAWTEGTAFGKEKLYSDVPEKVKSIAKNTSAIADALTNEDLTALVDAAERSFVNNVNLTSQTPIITINGANTGNTEADRLALSRAISNILVNQLASGTIASQAVYGGV